MQIPKALYVAICVISPIAYGLLVDYLFTKIRSLRGKDDGEKLDSDL